MNLLYNVREFHKVNFCFVHESLQRDAPSSSFTTFCFMCFILLFFVMLFNRGEEDVAALLKRQIMVHGKKSRASFVIREISLELLSMGLRPRVVLYTLVATHRTLVYLKSKRYKGKVYSVPFPKGLAQQLRGSARLVVEGARKRRAKTFLDAFLYEIMASSKGRSSISRSVRSFHKKAARSKSFARFRWF